tara:strand:+ start:508 stop:1338 length:831 start_codon:yes stop_codon:yes gene_type:complete
MSFLKLTPSKFMKIKTSGNSLRTKLDNKIEQLLWDFYMFERVKDRRITKRNVPFIIGINGSVSSGKSFFAKQLSEMLKKQPHKPRVALLSTDNFLYKNSILKKKGIMNEKGFPKSYHWKLLFRTLKSIKNNKRVKVPVYSQRISDISTKKLVIPKNIDILIVEGINILRPYCKARLDRFLLSDFLDYSIYINASEKNLKKWFTKRLKSKKKQWKREKKKPKLTRKNKKEFRAFTNHIWKSVNKVNLDRYIYPYRCRSDMIINKNSSHEISSIELRL